MAYHDNEYRQLPPRIQTALKVLDHTHWITKQDDISVQPRPLTGLEKSVENAAWRILQSYLLGEMDFGDATPTPADKRDEDDGQAPVLEPNSK